MSHAIVLKTAAEMTPQVDEAEAARLVSDGWRRAQGGLVEIIRFGATLLVVSERLERAIGNGCIQTGETLKSWLKEHCPEVNYKTAYGYMSAASGLRREARLAADVPLLALMGADPVPEARAEKLRRRVQKVIADSTLTLLKAASAEQVVHRGGAREGSGRPQAQQVDAQTAAGAAWYKIVREIDKSMAWRFERFLPQSMAQDALATVELLRTNLKARLAEFGKGA